ncbi:MAG: methyltransferase domain-containing protein [Jatrophihabitans sp.]
MRWDPAQYARYDSERNRPFFDLLSQVAAGAPRSVVDLGCGPGELTATLAERWPAATVRGLDSSPEMISRAADHAGERVSFGLAAAEDFDAGGVDVLISNALLQWVPRNPRLLTRWAGELNPDGWLAFAVPANFDSPSHVLMRELAESPRWADSLHGVLRHQDAVSSPERYLELLSAAGLRVNAWQSRYLHVLQGEDPVLEWVRGTGLRPVLAALEPADAAEFEASYRQSLRTAYPRQPSGTVFAFLRTFVVAHRSVAT